MTLDGGFLKRKILVVIYVFAWNDSKLILINLRNRTFTIFMFWFKMFGYCGAAGPVAIPAYDLKSPQI